MDGVYRDGMKRHGIVSCYTQSAEISTNLRALKRGYYYYLISFYH